MNVSHSRSLSSVGFTCRAGDRTNTAVANNDDLVRRLCLCRVGRFKHRESVRGEEQQPKHECYNGWADYFHTVTVLCAGTRLPLRLRRILRCYRRDERASLFWMTPKEQFVLATSARLDRIFDRFQVCRAKSGGFRRGPWPVRLSGIAEFRLPNKLYSTASFERTS